MLEYGLSHFDSPIKTEGEVFFSYWLYAPKNKN